jgi:phosphate transport system substrate-binding protein
MNHIVLALALAATALLAGCSAPGSTLCEPKAQLEDLAIDGSSTVEPIASAWAEEFGACAGVRPTVKFSGTGGGFQKFCRGEIDVADASRPIKSSERDDCARAGIVPFEIQVAIDGLAVVVPKDAAFVDHLSVSELNRIWTATASKQANRWSDLRPDWPNEEIALFGAGTNSGTFDYFVEVIIHPFDGKETKGRSDYTASEDDHALVQGVSGTPYSLGYFGLAHAEQNTRVLRIVPIVEDTTDGGKTTVADAEPVAPTPENVASGAYAPLSRPLFMYTDGKPTGALGEWLRYGLSEEGQRIVGDVKYVPLAEGARQAQLAKLA